MGPAEEIPLFRKDPDGMWERMLAENPLAAERVGDAPNRTKLRSTGSVAAFFRRSSGPGWALAGDAGHFKDPVIGQGMRDAMRFGRLLGEARRRRSIDDPRGSTARCSTVERAATASAWRATTGATGSRGSCPVRRCWRRRCARSTAPSRRT